MRKKKTKICMEDTWVENEVDARYFLMDALQKLYEAGFIVGASFGRNYSTTLLHQMSRAGVEEDVWISERTDKK